MWGHSKNVAIRKPGRELSSEIDHDYAPISDFQPTELQKN